MKINEIVSGKPVTGTFLLERSELKETRAGKAYLTTTLVDGSGRVTGQWWAPCADAEKRFPAGVVVAIKGQGGNFNDAPQVKILKMTIVKDADPACFIPTCPRSLAKLGNDLISYLERVEDLDFQKLLLNFCRTKGIWKRFCEAPGAAFYHHAYIGGLLEHTHDVVRLCVAAGKVYDADLSLLVAGAFLHDIGKMFTYEWKQGFKYSDAGLLLDHLALGVNFLSTNRHVSWQGLPHGKKIALEHLILSHHGQKEWGSPVEPRCLEALILHSMDKLDSGSRPLYEAMNDGEDLWTNKVEILRSKMIRTPRLLSSTLPVEDFIRNLG